MAEVAFTSHLQRHVECPPERVSGGTVREVLDAYFARHPRVRDYVLDEQGALRRHVVVFVGGEQARDRDALTDAVAQGAEVFVMQALSGG
jgi:molybdopterin synthase sulfur carrier subunit